MGKNAKEKFSHKTHPLPEGQKHVFQILQKLSFYAMTTEISLKREDILLLGPYLKK